MNPVNYLETGVLHCGDNVDLLGKFPAACVDMIYLDPPFFTGRVYEVIWEDDDEIRSFEDRREGGIEVYLDWMEVRMRHMHRMLKPTGSLYLHCDPTAGHYLKVMLDDIFGGRPLSQRDDLEAHKRSFRSPAVRAGPRHDLLLNEVRRLHLESALPAASPGDNRPLVQQRRA